MKKVLALTVLTILAIGVFSGIAKAEDHLHLILGDYIPPPPDSSLHNHTVVTFFIETANMEPIQGAKISDKGNGQYLYWNCTTTSTGFATLAYNRPRVPTNITVTYPDGTKDIFHFDLPERITNKSAHIFYVKIIKNQKHTLKDLGYIKEPKGKRLIFINVVKDGTKLPYGDIVSKGVKLGEIKDGFGYVITDENRTVRKDLDLEISNLKSSGGLHMITYLDFSPGSFSYQDHSTEIDYVYISVGNDTQSTATRATLFIKEHPVVTAFGGLLILAILLKMLSTSRKRWR